MSFLSIALLLLRRMDYLREKEALHFYPLKNVWFCSDHINFMSFLACPLNCNLCGSNWINLIAFHCWGRIAQSNLSLRSPLPSLDSSLSTKYRVRMETVLLTFLARFEPDIPLLPKSTKNHFKPWEVTEAICFNPVATRTNCEILPHYLFLQCLCFELGSALIWLYVALQYICLLLLHMCCCPQPASSALFVVLKFLKFFKPLLKTIISEYVWK